MTPSSPPGAESPLAPTEWSPNKTKTRKHGVSVYRMWIYIGGFWKSVFLTGKYRYLLIRRCPVSRPPDASYDRFPFHRQRRRRRRTAAVVVPMVILLFFLFLCFPTQMTSSLFTRSKRLHYIYRRMDSLDTWIFSHFCVTFLGAKGHAKMFKARNYII